MISTILFDFYGVFLPDPYDKWLHANGFERTGRFADFSMQLDLGNITKADFLSMLSDVVGRTVSNDDFHGTSPAVNQAVVSLVKDLSQHYSLGLLSNASSELRPKLAQLEIDTLFDHIFISSEMKLCKPQPKIFEISLERMGASPEQVVFIDDNPVNVAAAQKKGITSLVYTDVDGLIPQLQGIGIYL